MPISRRMFIELAAAAAVMVKPSRSQSSDAETLQNTPLYKDKNQTPEARAQDLLKRMTLEEEIEQLRDDAPANTRLGIPKMKHGNLPHGVVITRQALNELGLPPEIGPTMFPETIGLGSSWNPSLVQRVAEAIAREARSVGIELGYSPVIGVARDPRFGRVEETYGEDPVLVSRMGVAFINGQQGTGKQRFDSRHVLATAKHFAGYQEAAGGLNGNYAEISKRTLFEIDLPSFEAAVKEAGVSAIMPAHTDIDGIPAHMNVYLLHDILRRDWGFKGFVVSDNTDVYRLFAMYHIARNEAEAAILALKAGVDMELDNSKNGKFLTYQHTLASSVANGLISRSYVDQAARRTLEAKFKLGLFDHPVVENPRTVLGCVEHRQLALEAAEQSVVLLKNDGLLPLDATKYKKIAIIGPHANYVEYGDYAGSGRAPGVPLSVALPKFLHGVSIHVLEGTSVTGTDTSGFADAIQLAENSDLVIMAIGGSHLTCGEGHDRDELDLPGVQQQLFDKIAATNKPIVTILTNGRPLTIGAVAQRSQALLEAWYLGSETGTALSKILVGQVNPSGKLTMTFPRKIGQLPSFYQKKAAFTGAGKGKYYHSDASPLFPFGFGLSYTTFSYTDLRLSASHMPPHGSVILTVNITNTGQRSGTEVAQLYVSEKYASIGRWLKLLKDFQRVTLQPGETKAVKFTVGFNELSFLNANFERVVEPGGFILRVGGSSEDLHPIELTVDEKRT